MIEHQTHPQISLNLEFQHNKSIYSWAACQRLPEPSLKLWSTSRHLQAWGTPTSMRDTHWMLQNRSQWLATSFPTSTTKPTLCATLWVPYAHSNWSQTLSLQSILFTQWLALDTHKKNRTCFCFLCVFPLLRPLQIHPLDSHELFIHWKLCLLHWTVSFLLLILIVIRTDLRLAWNRCVCCVWMFKVSRAIFVRCH